MSDKLLKELNPTGVTITKEQAAVVNAILDYFLTWAMYDIPRVDDSLYAAQEMLEKITEELKP